MMSTVRRFVADSLVQLRLIGPNANNYNYNNNDGGAGRAAGRFARSAQPLQAQWQAWVACEHALRVTWAAFEYDCTAALLTGTPGKIDMAQLPKRLPCAEAIWEAPDAQAWDRLRARSPYGDQGPLVFDVTALAATEVGAFTCHVSGWAKRLCGLIYQVALVGLVHVEDQPATLRMIAALQLRARGAQYEDKASLLWGIGYLHRSINITGESASVSDLANYS